MPNELVAGGTGVDGRLRILGADGKPLLETLVSDRPIPAKSSEVRLGGTDRIGLISMHDATNTRTVRIDAAPASINIGKPGTSAVSMNSRQIIISGEGGREQFRADAGSQGSRVEIGTSPLPGKLFLHGREVSVTGSPVELDGGNGSLQLGRSGTAGAVTLFSADAKPRVSMSAAGASVRVGGEGANGTVSVLGADNEALVQLAAQVGQALIRLGRADRPARISLAGPNGEMVRLDGKTGDIALLNADCAEMFDVAGAAAPGTVMVMTDSGSLTGSEKPYDTRVAGVVSGAGSYRPGLVLDHRETGQQRAPIALMGKVFCLVDATEEPVRIGDLLTTSGTAGHAMAIGDKDRAFGAVLGKALAPLASGRGLIPVLVALQ